MDNCISACMADPGGEACMACIEENCGADFETCAGVPITG
jgi:hypothetical protein